MDNFNQKRSMKPLFIVSGALFALFIIVVAVMLALGGTTETPQNTTSSNQTSENDVATNEQVQQSLKDVESSTKQSRDDQTAAKAALEDDKKQIKVTN